MKTLTENLYGRRDRTPEDFVTGSRMKVRFEMEYKMTGKRIVMYVVGILILALGIDLNTKTALGVSPIISVAFCISQITGLMLGGVLFVYYSFQVVLQWIMLKKDFKVFQFLQVACAFITSAAVQVYDNIIPDAKTMPGRILMLVAAILITAFGAGIVVEMRIVPNPADGLANVIGLKLGKDFGFGKNVLDSICLVLSLLIGLIAAHKVIGIGFGTVAAVIFIGRCIALFKNVNHKIFLWTQK